MFLRSAVIFLICTTLSLADDVELEVRSSLMLKMLKDMSNQTSSDSLNLPANASSIRENITDTFSCENRTYGYYADVDNECQIFHVCLPSQTPSGRNVTYRWSFICPNETIFNQEVLVCTRPIDSIPCEESEMYYYVNNDIGKVPNNTKKVDNEEKDGNRIDTNDKPSHAKPVRRRPDNKKQNLISEVIMEQIVNKEMMDKIEDLGADVENVENIFPLIEEPSETDPYSLVNKDRIIVDEDERLIMERSMGGKKSFRFKADV